MSQGTVQAMDGRIPAFGYLCMPAHVVRTRAVELRREMAVYAIVSGLSITRWFVDDRSSGGAALRDMVSAIEQGEAVRVVVPDETHVSRPCSASGKRWTDALIWVDVVNDVARTRETFMTGGVQS